jgi:hypothetical protein
MDFASCSAASTVFAVSPIKVGDGAASPQPSVPSSNFNFTQKLSVTVVVSDEMAKGVCNGTCKGCQVKSAIFGTEASQPISFHLSLAKTLPNASSNHGATSGHRQIVKVERQRVASSEFSGGQCSRTAENFRRIRTAASGE